MVLFNTDNVIRSLKGEGKIFQFNAMFLFYRVLNLVFLLKLDCSLIVHQNTKQQMKKSPKKTGQRTKQEEKCHNFMVECLHLTTHNFTVTDQIKLKNVLINNILILLDRKYEVFVPKKEIFISFTRCLSVFEWLCKWQWMSGRGKAELEEPGSREKIIKSKHKSVHDGSYLWQSVFVTKTNPESRSLCLPVQEISISLHPEGHNKVTTDLESALRLIYSVWELVLKCLICLLQGNDINIAIKSNSVSYVLCDRFFFW